MVKRSKTRIKNTAEPTLLGDEGTGTIDTFNIQLEQQINIFLPIYMEIWNEFITFAA